jgi:hypothetical protein
MLNIQWRLFILTKHFDPDVIIKTKLSEITLNFDQTKLSRWALFIFIFLFE